VSLKVYDLMGQEVASLVNQQLGPGRYSYPVRGETFGLSSGVYFYRLSAGDFMSTRRMILLK
jgi:hypothetical protein